MPDMKIFAIQGYAQNDLEAIKLCADKLYAEGVVKDVFYANCVEREKEFPTGLPSPIPVAIPHSMASGVNETGICVLRLEEPVHFRRMDEPDETLEVQAVFNLAITDPQKHLEALQILMAIFVDEEKIKRLCDCPLNEIPRLLGEYLDAAYKL